MNLKSSLIAAVTATATLLPASLASSQTYYYPVKVQPSLSLKVTPKRDKSKPFTFTAKGKLGRKSAAKAACTGTVKITAKKGGKTVATKRAPIKKSSCAYSAKLKAKVGKSKRGTLRFTAKFGGNSVLKKASAPAKTVKYGRK